MLSAEIVNWNSEVGLGELIVGVATLLLAGTTVWLARRTSADVKLSGKSVDLAREAIDEQSKPFLVASLDEPTFDMSPVFERGDQSNPIDFVWLLYVDLENHGRGPAILDGVELLEVEGKNLVEVDWKVESIFVPDSGPKPWAVELAGEPPHGGSKLALKLLYRSATGVRYETSHDVEVREGPQRAIRLNFRQRQVSVKK